MDRALIGFSFDDGRKDNYTIAYPILKKYGLSSTFNITMGYIKGDLPKEHLCPADPMSVEMLREINNDPMMEIAGHGYMHQNTLSDIVLGITSLREILDSRLSSVGFASPGSGLKEDDYERLKCELAKQGINYVRLSLRYRSHPLLKSYIRKASRLLPLPFLYNMAYQDTLMDDVKNGLIYSVPVLSVISVNELRSLCKTAVQKKKALVLMFHSIVENGDCRDNWDYERGKFEKFCQWLSTCQKKGSLKVATSMDIFNQLTADK